MNENTFFIGIDSGGTKCELLITDRKSKPIQKKNYAALHYSVHGKKATSNHILKIIRDSVKSSKLNLNNCLGICIGLSGVREKKDKIDLQKILIKSLGIKNIIVESDTAIALHGAFNSGEGLILICGTGSILYGVINNKFFRIGGWGRIIGDYGSGYEIGKNALRHLAEEYDAGKPKSRLAIEAEKKFSLNKNNILNHVYHKGFAVQNLAPLVLELADKKDKVALKITDKALNGLLRHLIIFTAKTKYRRKINLALSGGIIESENILSKSLRQRIKHDFKNINLVEKKFTPSEGAIILAKHKYSIN